MPPRKPTRRTGSPAATRPHLPAPTTSPDAPTGRGLLRWLPFPVWAGLLTGAWIERASFALPDLLQRGYEAMLIVATAATVMLGYRRAARRRMEQIRANRARSAPPAPDSAETT